MTDKILIKPQTVHTHLRTHDDLIQLEVTISTGKHENKLTINDTDIFFDKDGEFSGEGFDLRDIVDELEK